MKYLLFIFLLASFGFKTSQFETLQGDCVRYYDKSVGSYVYTQVDEMPVYPGGMNSLFSFFKKNMTYPQLKKDEVLQTKVLITFVVDTLGKVRAIAIDKKDKRVYSSLDLEALRVAKLMMKWEPGKCSGLKVPVRMKFPMIISPQL